MVFNSSKDQFFKANDPKIFYPKTLKNFCLQHKCPGQPCILGHTAASNMTIPTIEHPTCCVFLPANGYSALVCWSKPFFVLKQFFLFLLSQMEKMMRKRKITKNMHKKVSTNVEVLLYPFCNVSST